MSDKEPGTMNHRSLNPPITPARGKSEESRVKREAPVPFSASASTLASLGNLCKSVKSVDKTSLRPRPASLQDVLTEVKEALRRLYGPRLKQVILYGSWARGDATSDSDIDVAVVLKGEVSPTVEIDRTADLVFDLNLSHGVLLSLYPVSEEEYRSLDSPLLMNLRREGIPA